jgi:tRNA(Ile)-lysidine synthase TilS/MesJ
MSIMHNGFVRTMKANYKINQGDVSVIRPLVYCRESLMTVFVSECDASRFAQWLSVLHDSNFPYP